MELQKTDLRFYNNQKSLAQWAFSFDRKCNCL
jgi:hypothetical protein